jgi:hypothetical protein
VSRDVKVAGQARTIQEFNTRKTDEVFSILERVGPQYLEVVEAADAYRKRYADSHDPIRIDRKTVDAGLALAREAEDDAAVMVWEDVKTEMGTRKFIERPQQPDVPTTAAAVMPQAMGRIRPQLVALIGLIAIPHDDLAAAAAAGTVDKTVREYGNHLYDTTTPAEAIGILSAGVELFLEDWEANRERLGGLWAAAQQAMFPTPAPTTESEPTVPAAATPPSGSSPSIDSDAPTTGTPASSLTSSPSAP